MRGIRIGLVTAAMLAASGIPTATAAATAPPTVAVVGDSYTAGWNGTASVTPWYTYTAADLGWTVGHVVSDPSGGYVQPGTYGTFYQALAAHPIPAATQYVLLQGGLNDANSTDVAGEAQAVAAVIGLVRQQAPNATVLVVGAFDPFPDRVSSTTQVQMARNIGNYQAIGPLRYMIGFMCPFEVGPDGVHPTANGQHQIGDWVAWHLAHGLDNGTPLHPDPTGSFYTA